MCAVSEEEGLQHVQNELEAKLSAHLSIVKYVCFLFLGIPLFIFEKFATLLRV